MAKSNYPTKLDTSVELPAVRDSHLSEPINSLRSAILQIEKTLGINPQGAVGNTLASRLNNSLDQNGNILPEAFVQAGLLYGPISNNEVSDVAAISESKLNLTFPTQLLQDEISMLQADLDSIDEQISELSSKLSLHINKNATNRHPATAISVEDVASQTSSVASISIDGDDVQEVLESIYNSHINYDGSSISQTNRSHLSNQIFFDNSNVSGILESTDIQSVIEELATNVDDSEKQHQDIMHSNGVLKVGNLTDPSLAGASQILAQNVSITFSASTGDYSGLTTITFNDPIDISNYDLLPFDFIIITDNGNEDAAYIGTYEIFSYETTGSNLDSVKIFGLFGESSSGTTEATICKNIEIPANKAGLLISATEEADLTSSRNIIVSNPNSTRVISMGCNPSAITSTNRFIDLSIDGEIYNIDLYSTTVSRQSIDSMISKINEQLTESAANAFAYRLDYGMAGSEITIVHTIPDSSDEQHTISVSTSTDNGIDAAGFLYINGIDVKNVYGTNYFINGFQYSGLKTKLDSTSLIYFEGSNIIQSGDSDIDFLFLGIKSGDFVIITESTDDGTYLIESVTSDQIRVISSQLPSGFSSDSTSDVRIRIYSNSISVSDLTFDMVGGSFGSTLIDVFMDKNRDIYYNKILEYTSEVISSSSMFDIVDIYGTNIYNKQISLKFNEDPDNSSAFLIYLDDGEQISISGNDLYIWVTSRDKNIKLKIYISDASVIATKTQLDGELEYTVYLISELNKETNLHLARMLYNNFNGRFAGGISGMPRALSKLTYGNTSEKDISNDAISSLIQNPISELRYNGVIYGFEIENISIDGNGFYNFDINRGVGYVNGKRIEKDVASNIITDISSLSVDKLYIIIDEYGNIQFSSALSSTCTTPFGDSDFFVLGSIEFDGTNLDSYDLRLFIDHLDLKLLNSITVSPQLGMGHFTDPVKALQYASRFSQLFPNAGTPIVHLKSGHFKVEIEYTYNEAHGTFDPTDTANEEYFYDQQITDGLFIGFPVVIQGEGSSTSLELINKSSFTADGGLTYTNFEFAMPIVIAGPAFAQATHGFTTIDNGHFVEIKDLKLINSRISCVDCNTSVGLNEIRFGINIDNVIFDYYDFSAQLIDITYGHRAIELIEISDTSADKGNITINGCSFIKSGIYVDSVARTKNITITNNIYYDDDETTNFLFNDIYSFGTADSGSNINIVNNRTTSNFNPNDGTGPEIVSADTLRWGERFSRDIRVGNSGYFENEVSALSHSYPSTKTYTEVYWADELASFGSTIGTQNQWCVPGSDLTSGTDLLSGNSVDLYFPYIFIGVTESPGFKVRPRVGGTLTNIGLGLDYNGLSSSDSFTVNIYRILSSGGSSLSVISPIQLIDTQVFSAPLVVSSNNINREDLTVNIAISSEFNYLIQISHDSVSAPKLFWISLDIDVSNIENALGLV